MSEPTAEDVRRAIFALNPERIRPGLERIRAALAALGDPHLSGGVRWVIVAGTNGKGSTSAFIDAIARSAGYHTGLYTSPHLERVTERMKVDGHEIGDADFARLGQRVLDVVEGVPSLTFFEALTALAFAWFAERRIEVGVLEVGLGGRLDATNVVDAQVAVITSLGIDHTELLGTDLAGIAREKAGVVRPGGVVVTGMDDALFEAAVAPALAGGMAVRAGRHIGGARGDERPASSRHAAGSVDREGREATRRPGDVRTEREVNGAIDEKRFRYEGLRLRLAGVSLGIPGAYQAQNATLAAAAAELLLPDLSAEELTRGLETARWPGRYERVAVRPTVILDGAHNESGARALAETLSQEPPPGRLVLVVGARADKDPAAILAPLWPHAHAAVVTTVEGAKMHGASDVLAAAPGPLPAGLHETSTVEEALAKARELASEEDTILVAGSLYLVGAARRALIAPGEAL